jgi:hypothetical protein
LSDVGAASGGVDRGEVVVMVWKFYPGGERVKRYVGGGGAMQKISREDKQRGGGGGGGGGVEAAAVEKI